jgi:hypothetical protein
MGHSGITDIQVKDGKICAYKPGLEEDTYLTAIGRYMKELGSHYTPAEHCIPFNLIVDADASNPDDIRVWGDFWVENYNQSADTLLAVSGGSYPGCMHVKKTTSGFEVSQFEAVEDGSSFTRTAKAIFGDRYKSLMALMSDDDARKCARIQSIRDYAESTGLQISCYKDEGWPAVSVK